MLFPCYKQLQRYNSASMVRLQNTGIYEIYNPQARPALSSALALLGRGLQVINSVDPCVLKSNHFQVYNILATFMQSSPAGTYV